MPLPATIPVKYTEEEAEYLSVRPVRRQAFRLDELLDMVLRVTGNDAARVRQILRSGTVVYHHYRYWWEGFEPDAAELADALARFPSDDPARPFRAAECAAVRIESAGQPARHVVELTRREAAARRLLRRRSFWQALAELATRQPPAYQGYAHEPQADVYERPLAPQETAWLVEQAVAVAPRRLRAALYGLPAATRIVFLCPRQP